MSPFPSIRKRLGPGVAPDAAAAQPLVVPSTPVRYSMYGKVCLGASKLTITDQQEATVAMIQFRRGASMGEGLFS